MALFTLKELTTPATRDEIQASIYRILALLGVNTTSWATGAVVRTMIVSVSSVLAAFSQLQAKIAASGFLDLAEDDWLTLVAFYVYGVTRIEATFAAGAVTLVNSGGGVYTVDADDLVVSNPTTGKAYRNQTGFTLGALATLSVPISAVESGAASTSAAHAITTLTTTLLNVTCDNPLVVVGLDGESDAALRLRCREKLGALSPMGPWDAYAYAARNARRSTGEPCGVTRTRTLKDGFGTVTTVIANASGAVLGTIGDTSTDLGAVDEAIQTLAEPLAVTAITQSANAVSQNIAYELWMYNSSGAQVSEIQAAVSAALITFFRLQPIGGNLLTPTDPTGTIYTDAIRRAIADVSPLIFHVLLTTPGADVVLNNDDVAVMGTITGQIVHQVAPAEGAPS